MLRADPHLRLVLIGLLFLSGCGTEGGTGQPTATSSTPPADLGAPRYAAPETATTAPAATVATATDAVAGRAVVPAPASIPDSPQEGIGPGQAGDKFAYVEENPFHRVTDSPLSTFSIDVDTASYSKTRAYLLQNHSLPPVDAVRIEELINYFDYSYAGPTDEHPFAVHIETAACPWQPQHRLVRFGIQGKQLEGERPSSNLVFLVDVSGSMNSPNKLPLVTRGLEMLVKQLGENDRVSIVVYAGAAGLVLPATGGDDQQRIISALSGLHAGGSTNGGQGIHLAYRIAEENFIKGGTNRVILCSDGDFNVGTTSTGDLVRLAIDKSKSGVFLSVLGFGSGNHNDEMLEQIADKANGNYAFIDSESEARKVLVEQMQGTLVTIAKDVKIQVEFNPAQVAAYRLIGYENRRLANRDFNDDAKDAGEIGAGHRVTVLYELVPAGAVSDVAKTPAVDPLKYQRKAEDTAKVAEAHSDNASEGSEIANELLTLKMRYQPPSGGKSTLMTFGVKNSDAKFATASPDFQFAAAVAAFGMLLRNSNYRGDTTYAAVLETAAAAKGEDKFGYRTEFLEMVRAADRLTPNKSGMSRSVPESWYVEPHIGISQAASSTPAVAIYGPQVGWPRSSVMNWEAGIALGIVLGTGASLLALAVCIVLFGTTKASATKVIQARKTIGRGLDAV